MTLGRVQPGNGRNRSLAPVANISFLYFSSRAPSGPSASRSFRLRLMKHPAPAQHAVHRQPAAGHTNERPRMRCFRLRHARSVLRGRDCHPRVRPAARIPPRRRPRRGQRGLRRLPAGRIAFWLSYSSVLTSMPGWQIIWQAAAMSLPVDGDAAFKTNSHPAQRTSLFSTDGFATRRTGQHDRHCDRCAPRHSPSKSR